MPELPEVQTTVNGLNKKVKGLVIRDVWTDYNSPSKMNRDNIKSPAFFARFKKKLAGAKIVEASRRGKNILIHVSKAGAKKSSSAHDATILIHMKMTGHMMYGRYAFDAKKSARKERDPWSPVDNGPLKDPFNKFIHLVFSLSDAHGRDAGQLVLSDMRKFAKVTFIEKDIADSNDKTQNAYLMRSLHLAGIGPEPLESSFTYDVIRIRLMKRPSGKIKTVLMTPEIIAGIGNIYSDEILWRAGVNPEERVENVPEKKLRLIFDAIKSTLRKGIDFGGDSMSDYRNIDGERGTFQEQHNAYRKTGKPCSKPGCKGIIVRKMVGARSAHFCNVHQRLIGKAPKGK